MKISKKSLKKPPKRQKNHRIQLKKQPKTKNQPFPQPKTGIVHYRKNHPHKTKKAQLQTTPFFDPLLKQ